jgi:ubiquinone/menaquinone biosynthesis C-methylase UbiE
MIDFAALAESYDRLRPAGRAWEELAERTLAALGVPARLLDVGCGTGRFARFAAARLGARVWGVDPSAEMLAAARATAGGAKVGWRRARAEQLPFRDGWFDAVHMHLVLHLVEDRAAAYGELARVLSPGGRAAVVTFSAEHFTGFHLNRWFPSIPAIDAARFPQPFEVADGLTAAGFAGTRVEDIDQTVALDPADVIERVRGRYISTLHLLDDDEYREGLARLERDLAAPAEPLQTRLRWALVTAEVPGG